MNDSKRAFITYMSNDRDYRGAVLLHYNLKKLKSKYPLYVITTDLVSPSIIKVLEDFGLKVLPFVFREELNKYIQDPIYVDALVNKHYYGKYMLFSLSQFEKVVYLDTDMLILEPIDFMLDVYDPEDTTVRMVFDLQMNHQGDIIVTHNGYNSGTIVCKPSQTLFDTLMNRLASAGYDGFLKWTTDQNLLNELIAEKQIPFSPLSMSLNCSHVLAHAFKEKGILDKVYVAHFMLRPKPWEYLDLTQPTGQVLSYSTNHLFFEWVKLYMEMVSSTYFSKCFKPPLPNVQWGLFRKEGGLIVSAKAVDKL